MYTFKESGFGSIRSPRISPIHRAYLNVHPANMTLRPEWKVNRSTEQKISRPFNYCYKIVPR